MRPAVFLDRDDTLIENRAVTAGTDHPGDLFDPALVRLLPGVAEGCRRLRDAGYALVVVSNQGGVARGVCTIAQVETVNARMRELLRAQGVELDGVYYCPFHPKGTVAPFSIEHATRKPAPGMLLEASLALELDLPRSWMIGDSERDVTAATAAGIESHRAIIVGPSMTFEQAVDRVVGSAGERHDRSRRPGRRKGSIPLAAMATAFVVLPATHQLLLLLLGVSSDGRFTRVIWFVCEGLPYALLWWPLAVLVGRGSRVRAALIGAASPYLLAVISVVGLFGPLILFLLFPYVFATGGALVGLVARRLETGEPIFHRRYPTSPLPLSSPRS